MSTEIKFDSDLEVSPEDIEGHDFRIPSIRWNAQNYELTGLHLPYGWQKGISKLKNINPKLYSFDLDRMCERRGLNWDLEISQSSGLITELRLYNDKQNSKVCLNTGYSSHSGKYESENIEDLNSAIIYQKILAKHLGNFTENEICYPYIEKTENGYYSQNLNIPLNILKSKENLTDHNYQDKIFRETAIYITGQFGTNLRYIRFNDTGLLDYIQIDSDDCSYGLDGESGSYHSHNVDFATQAATLHGITAEFINDLLIKKVSVES